MKNNTPNRRTRPQTAHPQGPSRRPLLNGTQPRAERPATGRTQPQRPTAAPAVTDRGHTPSRKRRPLTPRPNRQHANTAPLGETDRPADILFIMHELSHVLRTENDALIHHNHAAVHDIMERKQSLTRAYLEHMVTLHRNPDLLHTFSPDRTEEIKNVGAELDAISQQNEALLKAEITAANMFIGAVTDAVRDVKEDAQSSYSDTGRLDGTQAENRRLAIALNKEF